MASQSDAGGETRPRRAPSLRGRVRIARWLLAATIFGSAMAIGSIHAGTIAGVVAALALATWLSWSRADSFAPRSAAGILLFTAVGLTAFTALQTVPLPVGLLSAIAPSNAEVWARALAPLREAGPRLATLSLDPTATRVEVARGVAYLLTFLLAVRIASRPEGVDLLSRTIVITATVLGLAALLHPAFGAEKVFGLYRPETAISPRHIAPNEVVFYHGSREAGVDEVAGG